MHIWTTPQLNTLLAIKSVPCKLLPADELKKTFLTQSEAGDILCVGFDDDYLHFLQAARELEIAGPIILISPEPTMVEADLRHYHALLLDQKKMGEQAIRNIVHALVSLAVRMNSMPLPDAIGDRLPGEKTEAGGIADKAAILERIQFLHKKELPMVVAFEVREQGEPVTARSVCTIKETRSDAIVFHRVKQQVLLRVMKKGSPLKLDFAYKQANFGGVVSVQQVTDKELTTSMPEQLFSTRGIRIQPNAARPVTLYALIPNEPTTKLKVFDISPQGIGFLCNRDLPVNGIYGLTIMLPDPAAAVVTSGVIRFKKESAQGIRYGAEIRPHPWDEESMAKYIMKRETEIINLVRNM